MTDNEIEQVAELLFLLTSPYKNTFKWSDMSVDYQDYHRGDATAVLGLLDALRRDNEATHN